MNSQIHPVCRLQQDREHFGRHREIAIHPGHYLALSLPDAGHQGRGQAALIHAPDQVDPWLGLGHRFNELPGTVRRIVVHDDYLDRLFHIGQNGLDQDADILSLIVGRQDDRYHACTRAHRT